MTKKEALMTAIRGGLVYCSDINIIIGYSDFGGGFYSFRGAEDGRDIYIEVGIIPFNGNFIIVDE